jgi:SAM-dependent methyltransferase
VAPAARVARALDVGCGTGLSTRPLRRLARTVVGLDPAAAMLREAKRARRASYVQGRAEQLPVTDASFDVVTIGCAYHWCDSEAFLGEAARILRSGGALVIYDNGFLGEVSGSAAILEWLKSEHWSRLPRPPRNPLPELASFRHPFLEITESGFIEDGVRMSRQELITYLTTQSGAVAAVESGARSLKELEAFLHDGLSGLVSERGCEFRFGGPIFLLRRRG